MRTRLRLWVNTLLCSVMAVLFVCLGSMSASASDGWVQEGESWYYYENGEKVCDTVKEIGGKYYGFDWEGVMYHDTRFYVYGYEDNSYKYYLAKSDGTLYVNEWYHYQDDWSDIWYYYGEGGKAPSGISNVRGKQYWFYEGQMLIDYTVADGMSVYSFGSDGVLCSSATLTNNKWTLFEDRYYYAKNNAAVKDCVIRIGEKLYGFSNTGYMYDDTDGYFCSYYEGTYGCFRAKADGSLIENSWYEDAYGSRYHYEENGFSSAGVTEIDGNLYYFYSDFALAGGVMMTDTVVSDGEKNYIASGSGVLTEMKEGWNKCDEKYYYQQGGEYARYEVRKIGDKYYGFASNGAMYDDEPFSMWMDDIEYYRAKSGGALYVNEWYQDEYDDLYYYGEGGKAASGFTQVGENTYFFSAGKKLVNTTCLDNGKVYKIDSEGKAHEFSEGWNQYEGQYYYVSNGELARRTVIKIGNTYYGFDDDGVMYDDRDFSFDEYDSEAGYWRYYYYRAKAGGALYVNEWYHYYYEEEWGEVYDYWYYYGEDGRAASGFTQIGEDTYFFSEEGQKMVNTTCQANGKVYRIDSEGKAYELNEGWNKCEGKYYYVSNGELARRTVIKIGNAYYGFDYDGVMYDDREFSFDEYDSEAGYWRYYYYRAKAGGALYVNEWYKDEYNYEYVRWYYYGEGGIAASGFTAIGTSEYCFSSEGVMIVNDIYQENGKVYMIDSEGKAHEFKEGWNKYEGKYYYVSNGECVSNAVKKIGSSYYGFDYDGVMYDDKIFEMWEYDSEGNGTYWYYRAKAGGALYVNEWYHYYYEEG